MLQTKFQYTINTENARQKETFTQTFTQETQMYVVHPNLGVTSTKSSATSLLKEKPPIEVYNKNCDILQYPS